MSKSKNLGIEVDFFGLRTFENALRKVDPELRKQLENTAKEPMMKVRNSARRMVTIAANDVPSGWKKPSGGQKGWGSRDKLMWDNSKVRNGIVLRKNVKTKAGFTNYYTLFNQSAAGNIYEFAKNSDSTQGVSFVRALNRQRTSRLIWRAWDEAGGENVVRPAIIEAIEQVAKDFEKQMSQVPKGDRIGFR
jgi:hypothetical protein